MISHDILEFVIPPTSQHEDHFGTTNAKLTRSFWDGGSNKEVWVFYHSISPVRKHCACHPSKTWPIECNAKMYDKLLKSGINIIQVHEE